MPTCDYPRVLDRIIGDFHTKEARFWNAELQIVGIENIRETAVLPWAAQSIPRRFCSGTAVINDGARRPIFYSIAEDTGSDWLRMGHQILRGRIGSQFGLRSGLPRRATLMSVRGAPGGGAMHGGELPSDCRNWCASRRQ